MSSFLRTYCDRILIVTCKMRGQTSTSIQKNILIHTSARVKKPRRETISCKAVPCNYDITFRNYRYEKSSHSNFCTLGSRCRPSFFLVKYSLRTQWVGTYIHILSRENLPAGFRNYVRTSITDTFLPR